MNDFKYAIQIVEPFLNIKEVRNLVTKLKESQIKVGELKSENAELLYKLNRLPYKKPINSVIKEKNCTITLLEKKLAEKNKRIKSLEDDLSRIQNVLNMY